MKVLALTHDDPFTGHSGVAVYCRDLLPAMSESGVEVAALSCGPRQWGPPRLRESRRGKIRHFEIANSPIDPDASLSRPLQDLAHPKMEALVRECVEAFRPDVLHVHTLHGYPGSIIPEVKQLGVHVVVTLHDYWSLCPEVLLVRRDGLPCDGPDEGRACVQFCAAHETVRRTVYRAGMRLPSGVLRTTFLSIRSAYRILTARHTSMWDSPPVRSVPSHLLSAHGIRAPSLLRALGQADEILAVSEFAKAAYVRHGVPSELIRVVRLALNMTPQDRPRRSDRIVFGFLGRATPLKGAHVLAEAARGIPAERARIRLYGPADAESRKYLERVAGPGRLEFHGAYTRDQLPHILSEVDVIIVPSIGQETVGLATLEAQAAGVPVVGSRVGAIPEMIRHGENGLLFPPGDAAGLREHLLRILDEPAMIGRMSSMAVPVEGFDRHVERLLEIYGQMMGQRRERAWAGSA